MWAVGILLIIIRWNNKLQTATAWTRATFTSSEQIYYSATFPEAIGVYDCRARYMISAGVFSGWVYGQNTVTVPPIAPAPQSDFASSTTTSFSYSLRSVGNVPSGDYEVQYRLLPIDSDYGSLPGENTWHDAGANTTTGAGTVTGLLVGRLYRLRARRGNSPWSTGTVNGLTRSLAQTLSATDRTTTAITVGWSGGGFHLLYEYLLEYRAGTSGNFTSVNNIHINASAYTITGLSPNTSYQFRLSMLPPPRHRQTERTIVSSIFTASTENVAGTAPTITVGTVKGGSVALSWTAGSVTSGTYDIEYRAQYGHICLDNVAIGADGNNGHNIFSHARNFVCFPCPTHVRRTMGICYDDNTLSRRTCYHIDSIVGNICLCDLARRLRYL